MTYIIRDSAFSAGGVSIFRLETHGGQDVEVYVTEAKDLYEARLLCGSHRVISLCVSESQPVSN